MKNTQNFILSCCSAVDMNAQRLADREISYACFHYTLDGVEYLDDLGATMPMNEFYAKMAAGADTKTSQINSAEFTEYFENLLKEGKDILHISLSSGLSGTFRSAVLAAEELMEKYPDRRILVADSLGASAGYGLLVDLAADVRDEGKSIDEVYAWVKETALNIHHWFFSTDLTFYVKGGRVSKAAGWFGTALKICPLLNMSYDGKLVPREKIRTKPRVIKAIVDKMVLCAKDGENYSGKCFISNSGCLEDALAAKALIEEKFKNIQCIEVSDIGTIIGSHSGPGTVALFFEGTKRVD